MNPVRNSRGGKNMRQKAKIFNEANLHSDFFYTPNGRKLHDPDAVKKAGVEHHSIARK